MPTLSDNDDADAAAANQLSQRQSTHINEVTTFRFLLCYRPWDQMYRCPKIAPNCLIATELDAMWIIFKNIWRTSRNWNHINYGNDRVIMALLVLAAQGQPIHALATRMSKEQQETLEANNNGITLLLVVRAAPNLVILGQYEQDQIRIAFGQRYSIDELLDLTTDHNVEDLVLQTLFMMAFKAQFNPEASHTAAAVAYRLHSNGWRSTMFDARPALTVPHRLRTIMDGLPRGEHNEE